MWWWNDFWPMPWVFGPLMMLFFMALCMGMMWFMMRGMGGRGGHYTNAVDILNERFARGELTQSEYEERRRLLKA
jgi:uncharacterized membrane protein